MNKVISVLRRTQQPAIEVGDGTYRAMFFMVGDKVKCSNRMVNTGFQLREAEEIPDALYAFGVKTIHGIRKQVMEKFTIKVITKSEQLTFEF